MWTCFGLTLYISVCNGPRTGCAAAVWIRGGTFTGPGPRRRILGTCKGSCRDSGLLTDSKEVMVLLK